jgi:hypothetical protein
VAAPLVPVKGKIVNQSKEPLALVLVLFWPRQRSDPNLPPHYDDGTQKDGSFSVHCPPGEYTVTVTRIPTHGGAGGVEGPPGAARLKDTDPRYADPQLSPWTVTVPEGGKDDVLLTIK